jgi:adenylosuccinate synthase
MIADIIVDLQYGDCGKGKVTHHLCKTGEYTHVIRYNGGCNAGHTIYHEGQKFVTHHIPAGVFFGIKSIIGPGCVVSSTQFFKEIEQLEEAGIKTKGIVFIANNAHVITDDHLQEDSKDTSIGTTKRGNGPAYRDKYGRKGIHAEDMACFKDYLIDVYQELHQKQRVPEGYISLDPELHNCFESKVLFEGAQGFGLDIDWGDYPYVTSSHCTSAAALLNGVPPQAVRKIWGVAKMYETYVGAKKFQPEDDVFNMLRHVGNEYGATTGRPRQCNWMDWDLLEKAININGVTDIVFNKVDVLQKIDRWSLIKEKNKIEFGSENEMKKWMINHLSPLNTISDIHFSADPSTI